MHIRGDYSPKKPLENTFYKLENFKKDSPFKSSMEKLKNITNIFSLFMSKKEERDYWSIVIVSGALVILIWALLKAFGVINSPAWVEMLPYFGAGASIIGASYKLGKIKKGIEETEKKVDKVLVIEERFNKIENEHNLALCGKLNIKH